MSEEVKKAPAKKPVAAKPAPAKKPAAPKAVPAKAPAAKKVEAKPVAKREAPYVSNGEIRVELVRSIAGCTKRQIQTVRALGLGSKIGTTRVHKDNLAIQGMCKLVEHLVKVEKI